MSFRTIEVDVINGRIQPTGNDQLPEHARGLLTLLTEPSTPPNKGESIGLKKFLELPHIPVTAEQVHKSLEEDYYDQ